LEIRPVVVSHQYSQDQNIQIFTSYESVVRAVESDSDDETSCCCCLQGGDTLSRFDAEGPAKPFSREIPKKAAYEPSYRPRGCLDSIRVWFGGTEGSLAGILTVHVSLLVYAFCYQISAVVLPYLAEEVQMDTVQYGGLIATFCSLQLIGGVLFGRAGDIFGTKAMMIVAHTAACLSYFMMSFASTKLGLYMSEVPGLLQHGMQGSNMLIAHMSSGDQRIKALGRLGFSYGIGAILGPLVCGHMGMIKSALEYMMSPVSSLFSEEAFHLWSGNAAMLWLCIVVSVFIIVIIVSIIPSNPKADAKPISPSKHNPTSPPSDEKLNKSLGKPAVPLASSTTPLLQTEPTELTEPTTTNVKSKLRNVFSLTAILRLGRYKFVRRLLLAKFGILFPSALFMSMVAQFCVAEFRFDPTRTGRLLSYVPLVRMVGQGLLVNPLVKIFSETSMIRGSCIVIALSMLFIGNATTEMEL